MLSCIISIFANFTLNLGKTFVQVSGDLIIYFKTGIFFKPISDSQPPECTTRARALKFVLSVGLDSRPLFTVVRGALKAVLGFHIRFPFRFKLDLTEIINFCWRSFRKKKTSIQVWSNLIWSNCSGQWSSLG